MRFNRGSGRLYMSEFEIRGKMANAITTSTKSGRKILASVLLFSTAFGALVMAGCGGSASPSTPTSTKDSVYTYQGVGNVVPANENAAAYIPFWTFVVGETESSFRYNDITATTTSSDVVSGSYVADSGYLALQPVGGSLTYALTIPGEAALLRPGNNTTPPVIAAGMTSCPVLKSSETFLFVALPGAYWTSTGNAAYGTIQASTDSTGTAWSFSGQSQSLLASTGTPPPYPASFTGTCGQGITGWSVGVVPTIAAPYNNATLSISPSGFFTESATGEQTGSNIGANYPQPPFVGLVAPSSALDTTSLAAGKYLGFMYESLPGNSQAPPTATQLVSFGTVTPGSGTMIIGGVFPKDDPSQTPASNITVNFGSESASQDGLYTGVAVTIPDTSTIAGTCAKNGGTSSTSSSGALLCSFPAVAVAGNPTGKFAIFLIGQDPTQSNAPFGLYLYQQ
jgi:hypothetical protein